MSMIFDGFPSVAEAGQFVAAVTGQHGLAGQVFTTAAEANAHDPFPFPIEGIVVHIDRPYDAPNMGAIEQQVEALVPEFAGEYVGT